MSSPPEEHGAPFSAEKYFATQPPPPSLEVEVLKVRDFVQRQVRDRRKVVLVTVSRAVTISILENKLTLL